MTGSGRKILEDRWLSRPGSGELTESRTYTPTPTQHPPTTQGTPRSPIRITFSEAELRRGWNVKRVLEMLRTWNGRGD